jgi:hypothetical protein
MSDLSRELRALAADTEWPATPDLAGAVAARLPTGSERGAAAHPRRRRRRVPPRRLVLVLCALLLLVPATALALPGPRHAILETLGLRHVTVERRTPLPPAARDPHLGDRTTLSGAARIAGFAPRVPARLGPPDRVFVRQDIVTLVYDHERLLLAQARGGLQPGVLQKVLAVAASARRVRVAASPGIFVADPHDYRWSDATGPLIRSGPALIWERRGLVLRLEGERSLRDALRVAESVP